MSELWAVHVEGPDDVVAMVDKESAEREAAAINAFWERYKQRPDASEHLPNVTASVIPWDGPAWQHAADLAEHGGRYEP